MREALLLNCDRATKRSATRTSRFQQGSGERSDRVPWPNAPRKPDDKGRSTSGGVPGQPRQLRAYTSASEAAGSSRLPAAAARWIPRLPLPRSVPPRTSSLWHACQAFIQPRSRTLLFCLPDVSQSSLRGLAFCRRTHAEETCLRSARGLTVYAHVPRGSYRPLALFEVS